MAGLSAKEEGGLAASLCPRVWGMSPCPPGQSLSPSHPDSSQGTVSCLEPGNAKLAPSPRKS